MNKINIDMDFFYSKNATFGFTDKYEKCNQCGEETAMVMTTGGVSQPCGACDILNCQKKDFEDIANSRIGQYKSIMDFAYIEKGWNDVTDEQSAKDAARFCNSFKLGQWAAVYGKFHNDLKTIKNMMIKDLAMKNKYKIRQCCAYDIILDLRDTYKKSGTSELDIFRRYSVPDILFIDGIEVLHAEIVKNKAGDIVKFLHMMVDSYKKKHKSMMIFSDNAESLNMVFGDVLDGVNMSKIKIHQ